MRSVLEREGLHVIEAEHGQQAIDLARAERPDLLVIDLHMPEMNGFDAIRQLRQEPALLYLPIIVVTSESDPRVEQEVLTLGADDYLSKPIEAPLLAARVRAVFRRSNRVAA
jgi:two-component system alkaline phosphatase synthesis response regulator PhoP